MPDPSGPVPSANDRAATPPALWAVIIAFAALAGLYSILVPPFETPDEIWHFAFIQHLAGGEGLPISEADTQALWRQQGVQAPGYYLAAALLTGWIDQSDFPQLYARANPHRAIGQPGAHTNRNYLIHYESDGWPWTGSVLALHIARLFSVLLGAVTLWASYHAVVRILGRRYTIAAVAFFAFIPQFVFISAAASNDNAVNALAALVLWRLTLLLVPDAEQPASPESHAGSGVLRRDLLIIGVLLGLAVLSKLSALGLIGLTGLVVLLCAWRQRTVRPVLQAVLWIGVPVSAIAGWWYVRNFVLYGDPLAWNVWQANILLRVDTATWRTVASELTSLERSFWGLFGWLNVPYPDFVYLLLRIVSLLIVAGWLVVATRWLVRSRKVDVRWLGGLLLLLWLLVLAVSWLRFMRIAPAAQGRYFFPAAPALVLLIALGMQGWRVRTLGWAVAGAMFLLSALTPFWIIAPAYEPPPAQAAATDSLTPVAARLGDHLTILGVEAEPDVLQPGQQAIVRVLWRAEQPPDEDYSVFVHLVDKDGLTVAQRDTMPGGGLRPTSQWSAGETRLEEYEIKLPATAYTPNRAQWLVGMYDAATGQRLPAAAVKGTETGDTVQLLEDAVRFGAVEIHTPTGSLPNPLQIGFQDNIELAGYELSDRRLVPGDTLEVTLYWTARGPVREKYTTFVHLLDQEHTMHGGHDDTPDPPSTEWAASEVIADTHTFAVSESAPPGRYLLEIGLYTQPDFDRLLLEDAEGAEGADRLLLGPLEVTGP